MVQCIVSKAHHSYNGKENLCELDSHADTCAFDPSLCVVLSDLSYTVDVGGFHGDLLSIKNVPIRSVAVCYDCEQTYQMFVLAFHNVFIIKDLGVNLLCPDQMRKNMVTINEVPLVRIDPGKRDDQCRSIFATRQDPELLIPLLYSKPFSLFKGRKPTRDLS